jgi:hypothetical protein
MRTRTTFKLVALITFLGLLSACGSDNSTSNTNSTISKAEFISKADAICTGYNKTLADKAGALASDASEEQVTAFVTDELVPDFGKMIGEIRGLGFPDADQALLGGLMDETEVVLEKLTQDPGSILTSSESPFASINSRLLDYGLTVCGSE